METREYNGWTNYETWVVNLWIDNDLGSQEYWLEIAREYSQEKDILELADSIKAYHEDMWQEFSENHMGVFCDLMGAAMSEVNWREIAEHLIDNVVSQEV